MRTAGVISALAALALSPAGADDLPFDAGQMAACLAEAADARACIGRGAALCIAEAGGAGSMSAGPCFGAENAWWEARIAAARARLTETDAAAEAEARRLGWPDPLPSLDAVAAAFEAHRNVACDYSGLLWGGGSGAGPAWMECRMQMAAEHALRLEGWWEIVQ